MSPVCIIPSFVLYKRRFNSNWHLSKRKVRFQQMEKERGYSLEMGNKILKDMVAQRLSSKRWAVQMEVANFER